MRACSVIWILLFAWQSAAAQVPFSADDCDADLLQREVSFDGEARPPEAYGSGWTSLHPNAVFARLREDLDAGRLEAAAAGLQESFRSAAARVPDAEAAVYERHLDSLAAELWAAEQDASLRARGEGVDQRRFSIDNLDGVLFGAYAEPVKLESVSDTARRALCWNAIAAGKVISHYGREGRDLAVETLRELVGLWDAYNASSYSQYPWEMVANGVVQRRQKVRDLVDLAPPRTQIILLHPGIAVEAAGFANGLDSLRRLDVLLFEPVGLLRYNASRTGYVGASALLTVPAEGGAGVGGLVHFGKRAQIGFVYRHSRERGSGLVFSLDVLGFLTGTPAALKQARAQVANLIQP